MGACKGGSGSKEFAIPSPGGMEETKLTPQKDQHHVDLFGSGEACASNFSCLLCAKGICFPSTLDPSEEKGKNKREIAGQSSAVEVHGKNPTSFNRTMAQPEKKKKKKVSELEQ